MATHEANHDMLSAYVDDVLSPDAKRSMQQHLESCSACADALAQERQFVAALDAMAPATPPADFVAAVMGRVAQHPAHRPAAPIPWRAAMRLSVAASMVLVVLLGSGAIWLFSSGAIENTDPSVVAASGVSGVIGLGTSAITALREWSTPARVLVESGGRVTWRLISFTASSGWVVQLTLLLLTVSLNYAFTRLVVGYQRRH